MLAQRAGGLRPRRRRGEEFYGEEFYVEAHLKSLYRSPVLSSYDRQLLVRPLYKQCLGREWVEGSSGARRDACAGVLEGVPPRKGPAG